MLVDWVISGGLITTRNASGLGHHTPRGGLIAGTAYYRLNDYGIDEGYPRSLAEDWDITGPIDCALHWDNGYTFIFKVHTARAHLHLLLHLHV